jgi:glutamyl-tRNA synthetase
MSVRVRMAPSPTGYLHIGGAHTFLFNWLFARHQGGECLLRIENTDTSREVEQAIDQIQRSLSWLGIDWDGEVTYQLEAMDRCRQLAALLLEEGKAYEDEGAIRFRMPDDGVTGWDDAVRGRIEFPNEQLEDLVIVRSDGRPTYNFASPVEDMDDAITHVIRGDDHIPNTPKQIQILRALGHEPPVYAHVGSILGTDGKKLSKRHGANSVEELHDAGYLPDALVNFLALIGWAPDGETTIMTRDEIVERFSLEAVSASPGTFDFAKLDWMNGVYLRALDPAAFADAVVRFVEERGLDWPADRVREVAPIVQEKVARLGEAPGLVAFLFGDVDPDPELLDGHILGVVHDALGALEPWTAETIETALKQLCESLGEKPRTVFPPIRVAVTGSRVSPGLYESLELLGKDVALERIRRGAEVAV